METKSPSESSVPRTTEKQGASNSSSSKRKSLATLIVKRYWISALAVILTLSVPLDVLDRYWVWIVIVSAIGGMLAEIQRSIVESKSNHERSLWPKRLNSWVPILLLTTSLVYATKETRGYLRVPITSLDGRLSIFFDTPLDTQAVKLLLNDDVGSPYFRFGDIGDSLYLDKNCVELSRNSIYMVSSTNVQMYFSGQKPHKFGSLRRLRISDFFVSDLEKFDYFSASLFLKLPDVSFSGTLELKINGTETFEFEVPVHHASEVPMVFVPLNPAAKKALTKYKLFNTNATSLHYKVLR
jgi:hypothetical protein